MWAYGMVQSDWRLAARVVPWFPGNTLLLVDKGVPGTLSVYQVAFSQVPVFQYNLPTVGAFPGNVSGFIVEPD